MAERDPVLDKLREICLSLPDTKETITWGNPHFRVGDKIFCGYGAEKDRGVALGFKLEMKHAAVVVQDSRFWPAPYVGHKGWVSREADSIDDWDELIPMIVESYRLIAPKKSLAKLDGADATSAKRPVKRPAKKAAKKKKK